MYILIILILSETTLCSFGLAKNHAKNIYSSLWNERCVYSVECTLSCFMVPCMVTSTVAAAPPQRMLQVVKQQRCTFTLALLVTTACRFRRGSFAKPHKFCFFFFLSSSIDWPVFVGISIMVNSTHMLLFFCDCKTCTPSTTGSPTLVPWTA